MEGTVGNSLLVRWKEKLDDHKHLLSEYANHLLAANGGSGGGTQPPEMTLTLDRFRDKIEARSKPHFRAIDLLGRRKAFLKEWAFEKAPLTLPKVELPRRPGLTEPRNRASIYEYSEFGNNQR